ncbi:MAG TPA: hypothetical protein PKH10_12215, partial [bacterium]|nr:hypothetical protein [bacterium]
VKGDYYCTDACDPLAADACDDGYVCEGITDQENRTACVTKVYLKGKVFDLETDAAIKDALVMAQNTKDGIATDVVKTAADGSWTIEIAVPRNSHGDPATGDIYTLYASADDHIPYPSLMRPALPVTLTQFDPETADLPSSAWEYSSELTDIGLLPVKDEEKGRASINGKLANPFGGVLIVAECAAPPCPYNYADKKGNFTIFNVAPGNYELAAYKRGVYCEKKTVTVAATDITGLTLAAKEFAGGSVSGSVNIVNAPGGSKTSVVLIPESTFHETLVTGVVAPGLRAPQPPAAPNINGAFEITDVPEGKYVVLAAYENDGLVRDPDPNIAGTQIVHFEITITATTKTLDSFKITEALAMVSPGGSTPEAVSGTPTFKWADDSSEDAYNLKVYNIYGDLVWEKDIDGVSGSETVEVPYEGPALEAGMYYQWKAVSYRKDGPISTTEDLRGVFYAE